MKRSNFKQQIKGYHAQSIDIFVGTETAEWKVYVVRNFNNIMHGSLSSKGICREIYSGFPVLEVTSTANHVFAYAPLTVS